MDTRGLAIALTKGIVTDAALDSEVGLPAIPTAIRDVYCRAHHAPRGNGFRTTIWFGDISDPNLANLAITDKRRNGLKPYPLTITEGTGGGYGYVKLLDFPTGVVEIGTCICRLMATKANTATGTIAATFAGSFALGSHTIAAYATPSSTLANMITSATIVAGVGSVSGSTTAPGPSSINKGTLTAILDSSGGTASATIATFATGATVLAAHQNAIASLAAQCNNLMKLVTGTDTIGAAGGQVATRRTLDGTTTAVDVVFNAVVVDDATAAGYLYLEGRVIIDWAYSSAVPVTPTIYRAEGQA